MSDDNINEVLLERLRLGSAKPSDNAELLRAAAARLHSRAGSQDKDTREKTLARLRRKKSDALDVLLSLLENVRDHVTAASVAGTIHECIAPKTGSMRIPTMRRLVEMNATQTLVKLVMLLHSREITPSDVLMQELLWIIGQLSQRDSKFSIKTRLLNGVKMFHNLLKTHYFNHNRMLIPLLLIMKSLARNVTTTYVLVKEGISVTMEKTLMAIGFSPNTKLKLVLTVLCYLSRNNRFCVRMVKVGLVQQVLRVFERWERFDGKIRLRICYYTLQTLQHLCNTKIGRNTVNNGNGLSLLHKFCSNCPDDPQHDTLMSKACCIISLCLEKKDLPINTPMSPARFPLADIARAEQAKPGSDSDDSGSDTMEDEIEDEDDLDKEPKEKEQKEKESTENVSMSPPNSIIQTHHRDLEDLYMYATNWSEMPSSQPEKSKPEKISSNCDSLTNKLNGLNTKSFHKLNRNSSISLTDKKDDPRYLNNSQENGLKIISGISTKDSNRTIYCKIASRIQSVVPFVKVAYPDLVGSMQMDGPDPLFVRDRKSYRAKLLTSLERNLYPDHASSNVIYDLDYLLTLPNEKRKDLTNWDEERLGKIEQTSTSLQFESRFESGNLRKAIQVGPREYDLIMTPDVNSSHHHNWFYFEVSNMDNALPYTLNIINCDKPNSQFNFGMKPLLFSVKDAVQDRPIWVRAGTDICYYKNAYSWPGKAKRKKTFQTLSFTILFPHTLDVCYIAYHFPYTYSKLMYNIWNWKQRISNDTSYFRLENLCNTLNNNETPLITITAPDSEENKLQDRDVIFLTSRVHPGESNTSWVMQGTLTFLLGNSIAAAKLRSKFVIKIVPMLNQEGVINGCYRCGLSNEDLNRKWNHPDPLLHSAIYHTKGLIDYSCRVLKKVPFVYCDYHGHSRRKNVFLFGCSSGQSWYGGDREHSESAIDNTMLPTLLSSIAPAFDISQCSFVVEQSKESTARITVWREFGVQRSYTMESSYCGFDVGVYKGNHVTIPILEEMGATFCLALLYLSEGTWESENFDTDSKSFNLLPFSIGSSLINFITTRCKS